jgi:hypothetical protein
MKDEGVFPRGAVFVFIFVFLEIAVRMAVS